jgi:acyl-CoA thioester hydrolase
VIGQVEFRVRYAETDQMGVVYHSEYLIWCEVGRTEFIRELGLPYAQLEKSGLYLAVTEASLKYRRGARYDDVVRIETRLTEVRSRALTFDYLILNAATLDTLVSAQTRLVGMDASARIRPLPEQLREVLARGVSPS